MDNHFIKLKLEERYNTNIATGLSKAKAAELLQKNGPNCMISRTTKAGWTIFVKLIFGGFLALLWIGAILSTVRYFVAYYQDPNTPLYQIYLAIVLVSAIMLFSLIDYFQESLSVLFKRSSNRMVLKYAKVIRDGQLMTVPTEELVIGDLVNIQAGDCIPADIHIITARGLKIDNSSITGNSEMQQRSTDKSTDNDPEETQNLVFCSTTVIEGTATGIVTACGRNTRIAHLTGLTCDVNQKKAH